MYFNIRSAAVLLPPSKSFIANPLWYGGSKPSIGLKKGSEACLVDYSAYYAKVMQGTFRIIEKDVKWCNMKMLDRRQTINERLFKWHATGTVDYKNGFIVSIEKINLTDIRAQAIRTTVNGTQENALFIQGYANLNELNIGFDVIANLDDSGPHRFTGEYSHNHVTFHTSITWNRDRKELSTTATVQAVGVGINRHVNYRPANNITEMLSRSFTAHDHDASFSRWAREIIAPRMLAVAKNIEFPSLRFDKRC
ncbi:uncharacterized protein LOC123869739 [Maniola jurtina]|uniref:uncharacterized protein LOC123869739 n=1 Tax=Maniola jurtina TaxID=191418 RepID=UPI001E68F3F0|nr:uncharacterized protein LOC123869739 [Maniola jurtina]